MQTLDDYQPRSPEVISRTGEWAEIFVADTIPQTSHLWRIDHPSSTRSALAAVTEHLGGRRVRALLFAPAGWVTPGCSAHPVGAEAGLPQPSPGQVHIDDITLEDAQRTGVSFSFAPPSQRGISTTRPPLTIGVIGVDHIAPLVHGGVNLLLDQSSGAHALRTISSAVRERVEPSASIWVDDDPRAAPSWVDYHLAHPPNRRFAALRVALRWAQTLANAHADCLFTAQLPPLIAHQHGDAIDVAMGVSIAEVINTVGQALTSTVDTRFTSILRLPLADSAPGIADIIETMRLGDVDAEVFIDEAARFVPTRSRSRADLDAARDQLRRRALSALSTASSLRQHAQMFGTDDFSPDDEQVLDEAERLRSALAPSAP